MSIVSMRFLAGVSGGNAQQRRQRVRHADEIEKIRALRKEQGDSARRRRRLADEDRAMQLANMCHRQYEELSQDVNAITENVAAASITEKPEGRFRCCVCKKEWDGSQLYDDPMSTAHHWTCGDPFCGANVRKIVSEDPERVNVPKPSLPRRAFNAVNRWVNRLCSFRQSERQPRADE